MHDPGTVIELRQTVATLQLALTRANARIRELEALAEKANAHAAEAVAMADNVERELYELQRVYALPPCPSFE